MEKQKIARAAQFLLQQERKQFERKANRKWHAVDLSWMTLSLRKQREGFTRDIKIHFDVALSYTELIRRLDNAFGDL